MRTDAATARQRTNRTHRCSCGRTVTSSRTSPPMPSSVAVCREGTSIERVYLNMQLEEEPSGLVPRCLMLSFYAPTAAYPPRGMAMERRSPIVMRTHNILTRFGMGRGIHMCGLRSIRREGHRSGYLGLL